MVFEVVAKKFMPHFEGEKGENLLYFRKCNAYHAFLVIYKR
jgi:hypothetical protein